MRGGDLSPCIVGGLGSIGRGSHRYHGGALERLSALREQFSVLPHFGSWV
jgi:hypothetical protein